MFHVVGYLQAQVRAERRDAASSVSPPRVAERSRTARGRVHVRQFSVGCQLSHSGQTLDDLVSRGRVIRNSLRDAAIRSLDVVFVHQLHSKLCLIYVKK